ncbi:unnamed protein product [Mortierella alpina]
MSGHTERVRSVVFSPSGRQIASGSDDKTMRLWDVETGLYVATINDSYAEVMSVAWNAGTNDSYLSTGCTDKSVRMWKVEETRQPVTVRLVWSSCHDQLVVSDAKILNAQGLSSTNMKLLEQRGAISKRSSLEEQKL